MPKNLKKRFFIKKGESVVKKSKEIEYIDSLAVFAEESIETLSTIGIYNRTKSQVFFDDLRVFTKLLFSKQKLGLKLKLSGASLATSFLIAVFIFNVPLFISRAQTPTKYSLFSSKPLTMDSISQDFNYTDSRAHKIDNVYSYFNCPMTGLGQKIVEEADKNEIPYWVVAAISFQESSCGKNTPVLNGERTRNAWGWATYGDQVYDFDSFEHGIEVVSRYMSNRFYSKGVTELCDIMKVYTPPSNGSWCAGVGYFGDMIQGYVTPTPDAL